MTATVDGKKYPTKKHLIDAIEREEDVFVEDPSTIRPTIYRAQSLNEKEEVIVTNHPQRNWFAKIRKLKGALQIV